MIRTLLEWRNQGDDMFRPLLSIVLAVCAASVCQARSKPAKPAAPSTAKARPRYNPVAERIRFFAAAGKDSELDAKEFIANRGKAGGFVRKTESWSAMLRFDRDKNKTIDWFEADAYRRSLDTTPRVKVTTLGGSAIGSASSGRPTTWTELTKKYDADGNGKLTGSERTAAIAEYKRSRSQSSSHRSSDRSSDRSSRGSSSRTWAEVSKKHDKDGDGKLSKDERKAAYIEYKQVRAQHSSHKSKHGK